MFQNDQKFQKQNLNFLKKQFYQFFCLFLTVFLIYIFYYDCQICVSLVFRSDLFITTRRKNDAKLKKKTFFVFLRLWRILCYLHSNRLSFVNKYKLYHVFGLKLLYFKFYEIYFVHISEFMICSASFFSYDKQI